MLAALAPPTLAQSATTDSLRIARLSAVGRLWGVVKYFHPAFLHRDVQWDAATIVAVDRITTVRSTEEYRAAMSGMLAVLGDPATWVTRQCERPWHSPIAR